MTDTLKFYPKSHRYKLDGAWVPGVTTLLKKGLPKSALMYWSARSVAEWVADNEAALEQMRSMGRGPLVAALKEVPWQASTDAAVRGTDVHDLAERIVHGEEVDVPEHLADAVEGYVRWLDDWQPEVMWTERPVASRQWRFAGKPDLVCRMNGETWLLDWKTGKGVYGDYACQIAAYGHAEFYMDDDDEEQPMPHIDRYGVVHVDIGESRLYEVTEPEAAWKDFLHISWTARAEERIKGYLGEPIEAPHHTQETAA